jgi:hypothetical protein
MSKQEKEKIDVQAATLVGDTRDAVLNLFKNHADWKHMKEATQKDVVASCEHIATELVRKTAEIVAGRGFKSMHCTLEQVVVKDGLKIVLKASNKAEGKNDLIDSQGGSVTVVLSDINPYLGHRNKPEIDVDEPPLPLK